MVSLSPIIVKITDFGISKQAGDNTALRTVAGTNGYMAPEILGFLSFGASAYTTAVDIWSLGCLVFTILTGKTPFPEVAELHDYIQSRASFPKAKLEKKASPMAILFINRLMMPHPESRLTAEQALQDVWLDIEKEEILEIGEGGSPSTHTDQVVTAEGVVDVDDSWCTEALLGQLATRSGVVETREGSADINQVTKTEEAVEAGDSWCTMALRDQVTTGSESREAPAVPNGENYRIQI